jgi:penicillin-binding protein 1A
MRVALEGKPIAQNLPPEGMVRVAVGPGGQLLPEGSGGISEWVKAEDVERMASYVEADPNQAAQEEEAFDIF